MKAGFVGLGKMGQPMVKRLLEASHEVHVYNRSRGATDKLAGEGAKAADSARQVAERADIVMTALPTPDSVEAVYGEMAQAARSGQIFVDHSVVEVYANTRACLTSRIYPSRAESIGVELFGRGGPAQLRKLDVWEMGSIWADKR